MSTPKEIIIPISKAKSILLVLAAIAFVVIGIFFILKPELFEHRNYPPIFLRIVGAISILFFGAAGIVGLKKIFQKAPGLILNESGIIDSSSGVSLGLIKKQDIIGINKVKIASTKILLIEVSNPEEYVAKAPNAAVKKLLKMNQQQYGTPLSINSTTLKIKFEELEKMLMEYVG